jgi:hypothetical protein
VLGGQNPETSPHGRDRRGGIHESAPAGVPGVTS